MSVIKFLRDITGLFNYPNEENPTTQADYISAVQNWQETEKNLVDIGLWQPTTEYDTGEIVRTPSVSKKYVLVCTVAGTSGSSEPNWSSAEESFPVEFPINDGTVRWVLKTFAFFDASNIGANADSGSANNQKAWGDALGGGGVVSGEDRLIKGGNVYLEVRPRSNGNYIQTAKQTYENLVALDTQVKNTADGVATKANADASNIGANATTDNSEAWGLALGSGTIALNDYKLVNGRTVLFETNPMSNGNYVKASKTAGWNLYELDSQLGVAVQDIDKERVATDINTKDIDNIKKLLEGTLYDYQTDDDTAYIKSVPAGAMPYAGIEKVGGKTLVWNQLVRNGNFADGKSHWVSSGTSNGTITADNGELAYTVITAGSGYIYGFYQSGMPTTNGHKVLVTGEFKSSVDGIIWGYDVFNVSNSNWATLSTSYQKLTSILTASNSTAIYFCVRGNSSVGDIVYTKNIQVFDLTLMFGAGNEPSTVAEFETLFPASYYPYNAGELLSAGVAQIDSAENLLSGVTFYQGGIMSSNGRESTATNRVRSGYITVEPNTHYVARSSASNIYVLGVYYYKVDGTYINRDAPTAVSDFSFTTGSEVGQLRIVFAFSDDSTIIPADVTNPMLLKFIHSYPIPASVQSLEGYGWSAGTAYNYVDFERKVFVQNVGSVDLGTLTWSKNATYNNVFSTSSLNNCASGREGETQCVCSYYSAVNSNTVVNLKDTDKTVMIGKTNTKVYIADASYSSSPVSDFKSAMDGVILYYELATPIETDISEYLTDDNMISVESGGTLTFPNSNGADYQIPVPSEELYMIDIQDALGE